MPDTEPFHLLLFDADQQTTTSRATKAGWSTAGLAFATSVLALLVSLVALSQVRNVPASKTDPLVEAVIRTKCETGTYLAGWDALGEPQCRTPPVPTMRDLRRPGNDSTILKAQEDMVIPAQPTCEASLWEPAPAIPCLPDYGTN